MPWFKNLETGAVFSVSDGEKAATTLQRVQGDRTRYKPLPDPKPVASKAHKAEPAEKPEPEADLPE